MDADDNITDRWDSIREEVERATDIVLRDKPKSEGTIVNMAGSPHVDVSRIGIWIMPNNVAGGELEDFAAEMLPSNDPVWPVSQDYINEIPKVYPDFRNHKKTKAEFYAWLATRKLPGAMGAAIGAGDLEIDGPLCKKFLACPRRAPSGTDRLSH